VVTGQPANIVVAGLIASHGSQGGYILGQYYSKIVCSMLMNLTSSKGLQTIAGWF